MKKFLTVTAMTVLLALLFFPGCQKGNALGNLSKDEMNLLGLLPDNSTGVIFVNFKELAKQEFFEKMVKEKKTTKPAGPFQDYQDFVNKTGIDPQKDIFAIAAGIMGNMGPGNADAVAVVNLNYDKEKILKLLADQKVEITQEMYKEIPVYKLKEVKENGTVEETAFVFINEKIAALGKPGTVTKVIDLSKGEGKNVLTNAKLKPYIEKFSGLLSFVFDFPGEARKIHDMGMAKIDLTKAEVIVGNFNFKDNAYTGEVNLICRNKAGNEQLASTLNGFKGMAGIGGPEAVELVNRINISSSEEKVTLSFNIPTELLERISKKLEEKMKTITPPTGTPGQTEPTEQTTTTSE